MVLTLLLYLLYLPAFAGNKVDICHLPPDNPDNWHTITVGENALPAHLNHGDYEYSCLENCETLCSDDDVCTQDVEANPTECACLPEPRPTVDCDDSNECTVDSCSSAAGGCVYDTEFLNGEDCDDGDPDTSNDVCASGVCAGCPITFTSIVGTWAIGMDIDCDGVTDFNRTTVYNEDGTWSASGFPNGGPWTQDCDEVSFDDTFFNPPLIWVATMSDSDSMSGTYSGTFSGCWVGTRLTTTATASSNINSGESFYGE